MSGVGVTELLAVPPTDGGGRVIRRLAIVNRGEPATRALGAVAELNRDGSGPPITSIVLYTDPDADAWFIRLADEAICLGPATFLDRVNKRRSAYLDEEHVIDVLVAARADAVWVGWGFVAEHASFAERCEKAGIIFVGPESGTIRLVGDKIAAKRVAERVGVPVVDWSGGALSSVADAQVHAERLGYPVMLKAAAGGGGRGIRVVHGPEELAPRFAAASAEAELSFGDPAVFLERYEASARHVEAQVIADGQGGTWAVGVRDCSVQRRNQKVIEESASTVLDAEAEARIRSAAVRLCDAVGYRNAGTVEFLVDPVTGEFWFMEVNARLQVEHPVTEETTALDLVKLQLHVARGGRLVGRPPTVRGHAIEARLCAEDVEQGFAPAPGRIVLWRPPSGAGIRVDTGIAEGDVVAPEFDSLIAKIVAWGSDRTEALARLRRAIATSAIVLDGGTTNRSFLLRLLDHPDLRSGAIDNHWLDRLVAAGEHIPPPDPFAVLMAAIEAYDSDEDAVREAFHVGAQRGRPEVPDEVGHRVLMRYRGRRYALAVFRTGRDSYAVDTGTVRVPVTVERLGAYERRAIVASRSYRVTAIAQGTAFNIDVDGAAHRVHRDDGGVVRAGWPAFVISVLVQDGDRVAAGDPIVVLESMKMETTVLAPFSGEVADVHIAAKTQVDAAAPMLRIREEEADDSESDGVELDFAPLCSDDSATCGSAFTALRAYLLGFDLDPDSVRTASAELRRCPASTIEEEERLLELFADVTALHSGGSDSERELLLAYLQWLDVEQAGLPPEFCDELTRMLGRYGVSGLDRTPALDEAVVWLWRSFHRAEELAPAIAGLLQRRLRLGETEPAESRTGLRTLLERLAVATRERFSDVADLARDLLFHYVDEPVIERVVAAAYAEMGAHLDALAAAPHGADRDERVAALVSCPQPMRGTLLRRWATASPEFREALLEVHLRRYYRTYTLRDVQFGERHGCHFTCTDYSGADGSGHLVVLYVPAKDVSAALHAAAEHLTTVDPGRHVIVDLVTWRSGNQLDADALSDDLRARLNNADFGRPVERFDITVTSEGPEPEHNRTQHFAFRETHAHEFVEDALHRNVHPMLARRTGLWRLSNFKLDRLRSVEDVYLFRGVAHENPADMRLFALAEVRDLTPAHDESGRIVALPLLERMGLQALAAMRQAMASAPAKERPQNNRLVLYIRPPFTLPQDRWRALAARYRALAAAANIHKIVLRVRIPRGEKLIDAVIEFAAGDADFTMRLRRPADKPIRPLTAYRQKVMRARRMGVPYPYEIVRMLSPEDGVGANFPPGKFEEYDLDDEGEIVPVARPYGENTANLVVGVLTSYPSDIPEGMARVAILGDPIRRLGALAEPECRRIIGALDLAERLHVPVEWFAISSGARIAMDSGTENMDWIGAVLRRIVNFTQAGGEINIVVTGINVGAQPYWNAEATMLMHTKGILVMTPQSAMVLTGKQALEYSGGVSAEDNFGIGGFDRVMGPNGQGQYWAANIEQACRILMRHYEHTYVMPGEQFPRRHLTADPRDRDVRTAPHTRIHGSDFTTVGDVFSAERNGERKKPFDIRSVMRSVTDADAEPLERWGSWRGAELGVVWDAQIGGIPVCLLGIESRNLARRGFLPADGPATWTSGTLFPQSSRKVARAINGASGNRPVVVLANLSGFDGSPESMRRWQLEYGAEIGRAVTNFRGPIVFVVVSRYHGGAFVVFSKQLNDNLEIAAVEGSYASVIGGAPAAGVVFVREVDARTDADPRVAALRERIAGAEGETLRPLLRETRAAVRAEKLGEVAAEFDGIHNIQRALAVGSVDRIIQARDLRPYVIDALERGMSRAESTTESTPEPAAPLVDQQV
ncbi:MAG TPA: carboxyl transferase domain-containing protein [Jatrophihabitans sp.]|jgi:acetyl/propionyl-CoA carboxylase alpha subunit/acetyl-CoA carboxylase carboxyltransferase component|nr:carboxyl transferase domain-containing protein [Jatrophihabitans sp.]